jgi:hypothetical protein
VDFLKFPAAAGGAAATPFAQPTLRSLVPLPPRVARTAGTYFIPAQPAVYRGEAHDRTAGTPEDAKTQNVTLTVSGKVTLGGDEIPWQAPVAHPAVPAGPTVERFITETAALQIKSSSNDVVLTTGFEHRFDPAAAAKATLTRAKKQWDLVVGDTPATLRVRLYRVFRKNDPSDDKNNDRAFDLMYGNVKSLENVRSYLEKDIWVPVRDFLVEVKPLPVLGPKTAASDASVEVDLPLDVKASAIAITPPAGAPRFPTPEKKDRSATFPRGHRWKFGPLDKVVEDPVVYRVEVTFGSGGVTAKAGFDLTITRSPR